MSVFLSEQRQYHRPLGMVVVVAGLIAGSIYFGGIIRGALTASQLDAVTSRNATSSSSVRETIFPEPLTFDEEGFVMAVLAGGRGVGVRLRGNRGYIQAYAPAGENVPVTEGSVRIKGKLTEVSCAYVNTLFEGQCTPTVQIESIEKLPIQILQ